MDKIQETHEYYQDVMRYIPTKEEWEEIKKRGIESGNPLSELRIARRLEAEEISYSSNNIVQKKIDIRLQEKLKIIICKYLK